MARFSCHQLIAFVVLAAVAHAEPQLVAVMQIAGQPRFVLSDAGETSDWLTVGRSFHGYDVTAYDPTHEVVTLRQRGETMALTLRDAHVRAATPADPLGPATLTRDDLMVRDNGPVRIALSLAAPWGPEGRRLINVVFDAGSGRAGMVFGPEGPFAITRATVPEAMRERVTDDDIAAINAHLATVRAKLGVVSP